MPDTLRAKVEAALLAVYQDRAARQIAADPAEHCAALAAAALAAVAEGLAGDTLTGAVASTLRDHDVDRMECHDHQVGACCPSGHHAIPSAEIRTHDARAALDIVRELVTQ